jgi:cell volume regulation protein A
MADPTATELAAKAMMDSGVILACGAAVAVIAKRIAVPDIVLFLLTGMLLGPQLLGVLDISAASVMNQFVLTFGAAYILFDGGATLRFRVLREIWVLLLVIATVGVLITAAITAFAAREFLGVSLGTALLLGAILASTDPATLVPVFKQIKIKERVAQLVMSESALNDAMGAILTFTVFGIVAGGEVFSATGTAKDLVREAGLGLLVGAAVGYAAAMLIAHKQYPLLKDYTSLVTLIMVIFAYMIALDVHGSGFMAVFTAGVMLSNNESFGFKADDIDEEKMHEYVATTALVFRIFIFILLGSQVDFALMQQYLVPGLAVVAVFMLVARPATVFLCALPDRHAKWTFKEMLFMCWTRETGVIPAALVGLLAGMLAELPNPPADLDMRAISSVTFIAILATIIIQATTTKWLARKLDLLVE